MDTPKNVPISTNGANGANGTDGSSGGNGSWDRTVEQAKAGAHNTIDKVAESMRPAVDKLSSSAHQAVDRLSGAASEASVKFSEKFTQAKTAEEQLLSDTREYVREKPGTAIAIAVAAGFLLRSLFRSR